MPKYRHASFAGETAVLENRFLRLEMHKRISGWGWGEIYSADGKLMGILDHLGEVLVRDQEIPMRLEASEVSRETDSAGDRLVFAVKALVVQEQLKGTSFEGWIHYPITQPCMEGTVTLGLSSEEPLLSLSYRFKSNANQSIRYIRGPWLKVGEASFGADKTDAIFPGVEWLENGEWSSGSDWFKDPWAMRVVPHPNKVSIPVMAASHEGTGIGLAWNPKATASRWFNYRNHFPQPVFASPNFIDRMNNQLMGLMLPDVEIEAQENKVYAEPPMELHLDQTVEFDAEIFLSRGDSLQVVTDWVTRHGLHEIAQPRWPFEEALHRIAAAYNAHLWHEGKGFGIPQSEGSISPEIPRFLADYVEQHTGTALAEELKQKMDWCRLQADGSSTHGRRLGFAEGHSAEELLLRGRELLRHQKEDGSFIFDPDGRHYMKDDFVVARNYLEPMGLAMDTALDICVFPAMELLQLAEATGEKTLLNGALKALDYCMAMQRPEGGDFWETPLHSPNLLAAGHAAVAYYLGYKVSGELRYKEKAVHWIRALLPFTHLWEPENVPMLYNTKPCLCSSDWYFANWVRDHVQWEVLETFALSVLLGIDWGDVDPEMDWHCYHRGVTGAAMRWMVDHTNNKWRPHNLPRTYPLYLQGAFDGCFADTHNSTTGNYGGMCIPPDVIAVNIQGILALKDKEQ